MRPVLFVCATGVMGGAEVYLSRLMPALRASGRDCSAIVPSGTDLAMELSRLGLDPVSWPRRIEPLLTRRPGGGSAGRALSRIAGQLVSPVSRRWTAGLQRRSGAILHLNTTRAAFLAGTGRSTVVEVKDVLGPPFFSVGLGRLIARRLAGAAQVAVANSRFIADNLIAAGFPAERVVTIVNGLDLERMMPLTPERRQEVRRREGWAPDDFVICCVGRLAAWKGQLLAVEGLAQVLTQLAAARLVLVGDAGFDGADYGRRVRTRADELGVAGRMAETGFREDAADLMGAADVVLHTSVRPEPLGLTPMEAQALGVPVVASRAGGVLETVAHRETGYLFELGNVDDLVRGLQWAAGCDRAEVARRARQRAGDLFDMRNVVTRYNAVYDAL